jgi:hypothetical protein
MPVIPLTITVSLCLVFTFVVFFLREHARRFGNAERESLLPLGEETPRVIGAAARHGADLDPDDALAGCGCRDPLQAPCSGCRNHPSETNPR